MALGHGRIPFVALGPPVVCAAHGRRRSETDPRMA